MYLKNLPVVDLSQYGLLKGKIKSKWVTASLLLSLFSESRSFSGTGYLTVRAGKIVSHKVGRRWKISTETKAVRKCRNSCIAQ